MVNFQPSRNKNTEDDIIIMNCNKTYNLHSMTKKRRKLKVASTWPKTTEI